MKGIARILVPERLQPIRPLLNRAIGGDAEARLILDDWIESQSWNVAHDLWMMTRPTAFQQRITVIAIGLSTTLTQVEEAIVNGKRASLSNGESEAAYVLAEAKRQLSIHRHAKFVRYIERFAQTGPKGDEVVLDDYGSPLHEIDDKAVTCVHYRARCRIPGCVIYSTGTHVLPEPSESNGEGKEG